MKTFPPARRREAIRSQATLPVVGLDAGPAGRLTVPPRIHAGWHCYRIRPPSVAQDRPRSALDLLRRQRLLGSSLKFARPAAASGGLELRAEFFVPEAGSAGTREVALWVAVSAALEVLASDDVAPDELLNPATASSPAGGAPLAAVCAASGWPGRLRPDGLVQVALEPPEAGGMAVLSPRCDGGFTAAATLLELDPQAPPETPLALARFGLGLNCAIRGVRVALVRADGLDSFVLEAHGSDATCASEVGALLASLSVAWPLASSAIEALTDLDLSRHYLAVTGGEPAHQRNHNTERKA